MPVTYINRKGWKYYLCQGVTKRGKPRYYFSREQKDNLVDEIPAGYEITESVNGIVSLAKARPKLLLDEEISKVRAAIGKHPEARRYRIDIKSKEVTIYESVGPDMRDLAVMLAEGLGFPGAIPEDFNQRLEKEHNIYTQYTPVMKFTLSDDEKRLFRAERMCYLGSVDDWIDIEYGKTIEELIETVIPALGTDDFFELSSGIITAIMFLIIIDRKFRVNEFSSLQIKTSTFTTQFASIFSADIADTVGYAKVFANQIRKIRPPHYVERPELENLLKEYSNGFFMSGLGGMGKTTLAQTIAINYSEQLIVKPKGKMIPVLIPIRNWHSGNIIEQIYKEIDKFYPVRTKVLRNWLKNKPMLLIFDGLDEHTNPNTVMMEIETLRKLSSNLTVIVTSRSVSKNSKLPKVALSGFTEQETRRQIELIGSSPEDLSEVIEKFHQMTQGIPLANAIAAKANLSDKKRLTQR